MDEFFTKEIIMSHVGLYLLHSISQSSQFDTAFFSTMDPIKIKSPIDIHPSWENLIQMIRWWFPCWCTLCWWIHLHFIFIYSIDKVTCKEEMLTNKGRFNSMVPGPVNVAFLATFSDIWNSWKPKCCLFGNIFEQTFPVFAIVC